MASRRRVVSRQPMPSIAWERMIDSVSARSAPRPSGALAGCAASASPVSLMVESIAGSSAVCAAISSAYAPLAASSAAWSPRSTSRPSSSTRISSQVITLERRCAMISVVRPAIRRSSAS